MNPRMDSLTIIPSLTIGIVESSHHLPPEQLDGFMERMLRSRICEFGAIISLYSKLTALVF